jgi:hypothetical protein
MSIGYNDGDPSIGVDENDNNGYYSTNTVAQIQAAIAAFPNCVPAGQIIDLYPINDPNCGNLFN